MGSRPWEPARTRAEWCCLPRRATLQRTCGAGLVPARRASGVDRDEIDDEDQGGVRGDVRRLPLGPVCQVRRDDQLAPTTDLHARDALVPALDHASRAELELERL